MGNWEFPPGTAIRTGSGWTVNASGDKVNCYLHVDRHGIVKDASGSPVVEADYSIAYDALLRAGQKDLAYKVMWRKRSLFF